MYNIYIYNRTGILSNSRLRLKKNCNGVMLVFVHVNLRFLFHVKSVSYLHENFFKGKIIRQLQSIRTFSLVPSRIRSIWHTIHAWRWETIRTKKDWIKILVNKGITSYLLCVEKLQKEKYFYDNHLINFVKDFCHPIQLFQLAFPVSFSSQLCHSALPFSFSSQLCQSDWSVSFAI